MSFLDIMQIIIFIIGVFAFCLSLYFLRFFAQAPYGDGMAIAMRSFLVEQIISTLATLYFSYNALHSSISGLPEQNWNNVTPEISSVLRIIIFFAMIFSTSKLAYEIIKIQKKLKEDPERLDN